MDFFKSEIEKLENIMSFLFYPWLLVMAIFVFWNGAISLKAAIFSFLPWQQVGYCLFFLFGIIMLALGEKKGMYLLGEGLFLYLVYQVGETFLHIFSVRGDFKTYALNQVDEKTLNLELVVFAVQLTFLACHSMWPDFNERTKLEHWTCTDVIKNEKCSFIGLSLFLMGFLFLPFGYLLCFLQFYVGILMFPDDEISILFYLVCMGVICFVLAMLILRWLQNSRLLRWLAEKKSDGIALFFSLIMCIRILITTLDLDSVHLSDGEILGNAIMDSLNPVNEVQRLVYVIPVTLLVFYARRVKKEEEKWNWFHAVICWLLLFITWVSGLKLVPGIPLLIKHLH